MAEFDVEEHRSQLRRRARHAFLATGVVLVVIVVTVAVWPRHVAEVPVAAPPAAKTPRAFVTSSTSLAATTTTRPHPTTTTSTTPLPIAASAPTALVATTRGCERYQNGRPPVLEHALTGALRCFALSDGSLLIDYRNPDPAVDVSSRLTVVRGSHTVGLPILNQDPLGVGTVGGHPVVFLVDDDAGTDEEHPILMYDTVTGSRRTFGVGAGLDSGSNRVATDGRVIVGSGPVDMSVSVDYYNVDGSKASGRPDLTSGLPYPSNDVRYVVISPDGQRLAYLDGPKYLDGGYDPDPWALVVVDAHTGHELQRTPLTTAPDEYRWLEFDGRWAVASQVRSTAAGEVPEDAVVVDTRAASPVAQRLAGATGIVTLDSR